METVIVTILYITLNDSSYIPSTYIHLL